MGATLRERSVRFEAGTGTPATLTVKEPRLARVQK
jgi:hypothetical protein